MSRTSRLGHISQPPRGETERCEADRGARALDRGGRSGVAKRRDRRGPDVRREAPARWSQPARVVRGALAAALALCAAAGCASKQDDSASKAVSAVELPATTAP